MTTMELTLLGYAAGTITSFGFIPQVIKGFKTKHMKDVALWQPLLLGVGMSLWFVYGLYLNNMPMILANLFSIICNIIVIIQKLVYK